MHSAHNHNHQNSAAAAAFSLGGQDASGHTIHQCMPFQGTTGEFTGAFLGAAALLIYTIIWRNSPNDGRSVKVFSLDLAKIAISGSFAWVINFGIAGLSSHLLSMSEHHLLQGIAWYAAVMVTDCLVGVPLGVFLGKRFEAWCKMKVRQRQEQERLQRATSMPPKKAVVCGESISNCCACCDDFVGKNAAFGKYWPDQETAKVVAASRDELTSLIFSGDDCVGSSGTDKNNDEGDGSSSPPPRRAVSCPGFTDGGTFSDTHQHHHHHAVLVEESDEKEPIHTTFSRNKVVIRRAKSSVSIDRTHIQDLVPFVPQPHWDWWVAQLTSWSVCVAISRILSGVVMVLLAELMGSYDPALLLARFVHTWSASCATKQLVIAGALRIVLDVIQIGFIDLFNHFDLYTAVFAELE